MSTSSAHREAEALLDALPQLMREHPAVAALRDSSAIVLHGSTTIGVEDGRADWDVWVLTDTDTAAQFGRDAGTRFIEFKSRRPGHFTVEPLEQFQRRMSACDFELISELRYAQLLSDCGGMGASLLAEARKPMSDAVRNAWFRFHYVEMRSEHRACDNAIERCEPIPLLLGITRTLQHALQAGMVLSREPYRYSKWLARLAATTAHGRDIVPLVEQTVRLIEQGALREPGPEVAHPINLKLRQIRQVLVDSARESGIDGRWLSHWYLHIDEARGGIHDVTW